VKAFRNFAHFVKVYWTLKTQADPEKAAEALGRPLTLELDEGQAAFVQDMFCGDIVRDILPRDPDKLAHDFFSAWPRTDFRYFTVPTPDGKGLEFGNADPALDGVELIQAAMVKLGAIKKHDDDGEWYYQTAHPMVKRMAQLGANQTIPEPTHKGIFA
jgi:hypothetical protein